MPRVLRKRRAKADLIEIWTYIAADSEEKADMFIDALRDVFNKLATMPGMGRARDELGKGLRSFPIGRYIIFYEELQDGIGIVRVLHGSRDMDAGFFSE